MSVDATKDAAVQKSDLVSVFIDGTEVKVPKGTMAIRAAELIGVAIPRFCDHPLLDPMGACRQCLVEVPDMGNGRGMPKPQAACTLEVAPGMKIATQHTSEVARKAQEGIIELLLINHPLDCPICDKGGECPLQNQAMTNGRGESRYGGVKRTFPKPVSISAQILLDRERCVLCARCTRFSEQIAGDPFIALVERGALQQVGIYEEHPYHSYFSGNVVQICPVGALTSAAYRFQARPFDLVSTVTTCEHCASGCELRTDHRHFQVKRRLAGNLPAVNEEWNCDRGRFAYRYTHLDDHLTHPLIREDGALRAASWPEAIDAAVAGLKAAGSAVGVLPGGRLTLENAYAYAKFARAVLGTNHIDYRSRPHSAEELAFLAAEVAGRGVSDSVTYGDLEAAKKVILVCFEPEEESPIVFLRLRKAVRKRGVRVSAVAPFLSAGNEKLSAALVPAAPGREGAIVSELQADADTIVLVGERAALAPGALAACVDLTRRSGARLAWIPRRAGELGAIEAGCLPSLLPGGRPLDAAARVDVQSTWGVDHLPPLEGMDADAILRAAGTGHLKALVVGGVQPTDFADAAAVRSALEGAAFVVSLEQRASEVTERADVVFPVVAIERQAGTFVNWEHRRGRVNRVLKDDRTAMTDLRVLAALADGLGRDLGVRRTSAALAELDELGSWEGARTAAPVRATQPSPASQGGGLLLATWRQLIDGSAANDGAPDLVATAKEPLVRLSRQTAERLGLTEGEDVTVTAGRRGVTLPLAVEPTMLDGVVWLPGNFFTGSTGELAVRPGDSVTVNRGGVV
jgi:NADH-quinone oxidoreductase subunit G